MYHESKGDLLKCFPQLLVTCNFKLHHVPEAIFFRVNAIIIKLNKRFGQIGIIRNETMKIAHTNVFTKQRVVGSFMSKNCFLQLLVTFLRIYTISRVLVLTNDGELLLL